jgi:hypothetical protein
MKKVQTEDYICKPFVKKRSLFMAMLEESRHKFDLEAKK